MKRIKFDKATKAWGIGWRKDYPGYLFEHSAHPGREFVIARGSRATADGKFRMRNEWRLYDRASGIALNTVFSPVGTRKEAEELARCNLFSHSPEKLAESITNKVMQRTTKILQEEP